jgi:hypothetical protein
MVMGRASKLGVSTGGLEKSPQRSRTREDPGGGRACGRPPRGCTLWRPSERAWIGGAMRDRDLRRARAEIEQGIRIAASLGVDMSEVHIPAG